MKTIKDTRTLKTKPNIYDYYDPAEEADRPVFIDSGTAELYRHANVYFLYTNNAIY